MSDDVEVRWSDKLGLNSEQSYVVCRGGTAFLRFWGNSACWKLVTATVGEDNASLAACSSQLRLRDAASKASLDIAATWNTGQAPTTNTDCSNRPYVIIWQMRLTDETEETKRSAIKLLGETCDKFFMHYDNNGPDTFDSERDLYELLAVDDFGDAVYLSDGVWLGRDGSYIDLGR